MNSFYSNFDYHGTYIFYTAEYHVNFETSKFLSIENALFWTPGRRLLMDLVL